MRRLKWAIGVMSVMIVAGVVVIAVTITRRLSDHRSANLNHVLPVPPGTRIGGIAPTPEGLAMLLQGGGPDRVVVLDAKSGSFLPLVTIGPSESLSPR